MKKIIIVLSFLSLGGIILTRYKENSPSISNITVSYADSLVTQDSASATEYGLIDISTLPTNVTIELNYATTNNFASKQFYPKIAKAYLLDKTAQKLMNANEELYKLGYRIKIYDAYRPYKYQQQLRDAATEINPATKNYIADPKYGSNHNRGTSIDITITDLEGHEIAMPTKYDYFGKEASINYYGCTEEEKINRELLGKIMENNGFRRINSEWWHFDDIDYLNYPILNVDFNELI